MIIKPSDQTKIQTRNVAVPMELRAEGGAAAPNRLVGYAAKFDVDSEPICDWWGDGFIERIAPGAFSRTLRENGDIRALYNHNTDVVLGRTKNGTLRLSEDETGLHFEVDLPDTQQARDVREMVRRGDIDGCSFGFYVVGETVEEVKDQPIVRTLTDIELIEISPAVAFPAYQATEVAVRHRLQGQRRPASRLARARSRARAAGIKS